MSYKPLTKQQAEDMSRPALIDDGTYQFELLSYSNVDKNNNRLKDKNGDPMTKIKLKIWDIHGKEHPIFTNIFWGENNKMSYRTRHLADSIQTVELYESGQMLDRFLECLNKFGYCEVYTQKERDKGDGSNEKWPAKNDVRDFVKASAKPVPVTEKNSATQPPPFDDDVPF